MTSASNLLKLGPYGALVTVAAGVAELARAKIVIPSEALLALMLLGMLAIGYGLLVERWQAMRDVMERTAEQGAGCALSNLRWGQVDEALTRVAVAIEADVAQRQRDAAISQRMVDALDDRTELTALLAEMRAIATTMQENPRGKGR